MVKISVLEFRRQAREVVGRLQNGQRMILTYRGKAVARMEPIGEKSIANDDPIYLLADLASKGAGSLSNEEMERIIYEK